MAGREIPFSPLCSSPQPVDTVIDRLDLIKTETVVKAEVIDNCVEQYESVKRMPETVTIAQISADASSSPLCPPPHSVITTIDGLCLIKTESINDRVDQYESVQRNPNMDTIAQMPGELISPSVCPPPQSTATIIDRLDSTNMGLVEHTEEINNCVERYESVVVQKNAQLQEVLDMYLDGIALPSTSQLLSYSGPPVKVTTNGILLACRRIAGDGGWPASRRLLFHLLQLPDIPYHRRLAFDIRFTIASLHVRAMRLVNSGSGVVEKLLMFYDTACETPLNRLPGSPFNNRRTPLYSTVSASPEAPSRQVTRVLSVVGGPGSLVYCMPTCVTVPASQDAASLLVTPSAQEVNTSGHAVSRFLEEEKQKSAELDVTFLLPMKKMKYPWGTISETQAREKFQQLSNMETEESVGVEATFQRVEANEAAAMLLRQQEQPKEVTENPENNPADPYIIIDKLQADAIVLQKRAVEAEHELNEMKKLVTVWNTQSRTFTDHCVEHMLRFSHLGVNGRKLPEALECAASFAGVKLDGLGLLKDMCSRVARGDK